MTAAGPKNCAWLKVLNVSRHSRALVLSLSFTDLSSARNTETQRHRGTKRQGGVLSFSLSQTDLEPGCVNDVIVIRVRPDVSTEAPYDVVCNLHIDG
jgi:hypothetical protein